MTRDKSGSDSEPDAQDTSFDFDGDGSPDQEPDKSAPIVSDNSSSPPDTDSSQDEESYSDGSGSHSRVIPELHEDVYKRPFDGVNPTNITDIIGVLRTMSPQAARTVRSVDETVTDLRQENGELRQQLQDAQREFEEFRRRKTAEAERMSQSANKELLRRVLPVRDDLAKAVKQDGEDVDEIRDGVQLVMRQFDEVLEDEGQFISPNSGTDLNPVVHNVMFRKESDIESGKIITCLRPGFIIGDELVRPARVIVSSQ